MKVDRASWRGRCSTNLVLAACLAQITGFDPFAAAAAEHPKPDSDPLSALLAATFRITNKDSSGTCFLLEPPPASRWSNGVVIVVTAAHAFEQAQAGTECLIVMRERRADGSFVRREVPLPIRSAGNPLWVKPPDDDVAAIKLTLPLEVPCQPLRLDQLARAEEFTNGRIRLGRDTWVFCFPAQLEANNAGFPVLRHGSIASLPLRPLSSDRTFLVDCNTFGGDSGAPVMVEERGASRPTGLIVGLVVGMERETDKVSMPFEERTVHHPLGLAIVAHSEIIRQTVERLLR
ncbi:MAG: trypsin-like serine peptidase [Limisphaerales bacterium]